MKGGDRIGDEENAPPLISSSRSLCSEDDSEPLWSSDLLADLSPYRHSRDYSRDGQTSCSSRTAAALRLRKSSQSQSSCPTHLPLSRDGGSGNSRMDSETPEGHSGQHWPVLGSRIHTAPAAQQSDPLFSSTLACGSNETGAVSPLQSSSPSVVGANKCTEASWLSRQLLQPVLDSKSAESCLGRPGAPPRRLGRRALPLCSVSASHCHSVASNDPSEFLAPSKHSEKSEQCTEISDGDMHARTGRNMKVPRSAPGVLRHPTFASFTAGSSNASLKSPSSAPSDGGDRAKAHLRSPSPASISEIIHNRDIMGARGNICRSALDEVVSQADTDRILLAKYRRDATKAAEVESAKRLAKFKATQHRNDQIFKLQAVVNDPQVRDLFPVSNKGEPYGTPMPGQKDKPSAFSREIKMPATVNSRLHAVPPPRDMDSDEDRAASKDAKKQKVKPKRPLKIRMRSLRRLAREKRDKMPKVAGMTRHSRQSMYSEEGNIFPDGSDLPERSASPVSPLLSSTLTRGSISFKNTGAEHGSLSLGSSWRQSIRGSIGGENLRMQRLFHRHRDTTKDTDEKRQMREKAFREQASAYEERQKQLLRQAFANQDLDKSDTLDLAEVRTCLVAIGLSGKNEPERQEIRRILWCLDQLEFSFADFSEVIVPQVRAALLNLRKSWLIHLFANVDTYGRRFLSIDDTLNAQRRLGLHVSEDVRDEVVRGFMYRTGGEYCQSTSEPCLDVNAFTTFVCTLQEYTERDKYEQYQKIVQSYCLSQEQLTQFQHDLVDLYSQFHEYDPVSGKYGSPSDSLREEQVHIVLRESGYMPKSKARQDKVAAMVKETKRYDETLAFPDFLHIIQTLREQDRERLRHLFAGRCSNWATGLLHLSDIYDVLPDCGLAPRTMDERYEVRSLLEEFDEEGQGILSREESVIIVQLLARKFRLIQHERERQYVISAGWTEGHFAEFRQAFWHFDEDMSEILERDELMKAVELLRGSYAVGADAGENLDLMLTALGIDPAKEVKVNFLSFLRMLKMLDETETRRQQGVILGFTIGRTDTLYTLFQAIEPENDGKTGRATLELMYSNINIGINKIQHDDLMRMIKMEPLQVEFNSFLRLMKVLDGFVEAVEMDMEDTIREMQRWADKHNENLLKAQTGELHATQRSSPVH